MKSKKMFSKQFEGCWIRHFLVLTTFLFLFFAALSCNGQNNETKEEVWESILFDLCNNTRGYPVAESIADLTHFPFYLTNSGEEKEYTKKNFIKKFEDIFDIYGIHSIDFYNTKFKTESLKATNDHKKKGVSSGSEILSVTVLKSDIKYSGELKYDKYTFLIGEVKGKNKLVGLIVEDDFLKFWSEFKAAVVAKDANKIADMTYFPIQGDVDWYFSDEENNKTYPNDKKGFIEVVFSRLFSSNEFKNIKTLKSGKIERNVQYKFTELSDGYSPDFIDSNATGKILEIYYTTDGEFMSNYYFIKVNGKFKFYGYTMAG